MSDTIVYTALDGAIESFQAADVPPPVTGGIRSRGPHRCIYMLFHVGDRWIAGSQTNAKGRWLTYRLPFEELVASDAIKWCFKHRVTPPSELLADQTNSRPLAQPSKNDTTADHANDGRPALASDGKPEPEESEPLTGPPQVLEQETGRETSPGRLDRDSISLKIRAAIETLGQLGEWNATNKRIIELAEVPKSTFYKCLQRDNRVIQAMQWFEAERQARFPAKGSDRRRKLQPYRD